MSKPRSVKREREFSKLLKDTKSMSYKKRVIKWFQQNKGEIVTASELARIPGKNNQPINHNIRRVFELRDEEGYEIVNHKEGEISGLNLKIDEWVLLNENPNPQKIRTRGVNKRIMAEVFDRDNSTCKICGRTPNDDDPFATGRKIILHVGHIIAHKQETLRIENFNKLDGDTTLTKEDFITMCNVCNEGTKNKDIEIKKNTLHDLVMRADVKEKQKIFLTLKEELES